MIYGANDGIITTFAVVAGAALSTRVILILGRAALRRVHADRSADRRRAVPVAQWLVIPSVGLWWVRRCPSGRVRRPGPRHARAPTRRPARPSPEPESVSVGEKGCRTDGFR